ncbi:MAG TPA: DUF4835 family protein [Chitinophagaceae bacterium]|nr:DUF4835 family protein [Chitinophagaceae bacterium]
MKKLLILLLVCMLTGAVQAQELQARVSVMAGQVSSKVDRKVFQNLQTALTNFLNNRKWTPDSYGAGEKIKCNFLLTISQELGENVYKATLTIQAARPVYGTAYESPLVNFQDDEVSFRYVEFQPLEFNENRVQGNDPLASNLTAVFAYYVNIILGMDYDSFAARGGDPFYLKAQQIVNNAPEAREIAGWKPFDGLRNRFKLAENFLDSRFALIHDAIYSYYRNGLDVFGEQEENGRNGVMNALSYLHTLNQENPNSMVLQFFFSGKSNELVNVFSRAEGDSKGHARDLLSRLDITNANAYKQLK